MFQGSVCLLYAGSILEPWRVGSPYLLDGVSLFLHFVLLPHPMPLQGGPARQITSPYDPPPPPPRVMRVTPEDKRKRSPSRNRAEAKGSVARREHYM